MASSKLTCPECETVLRPSKPVAPGKKVKCPKCETVFSAPRDDEEDDEGPAPKKGSAKGRPAAKEVKKEAKPAPAMAAEEDEGAGTYGYVKDPDEGDASKKPKIRYGPDTSIVDPRGPATVKLAGPAGKLQLVGLIGTLGWLMWTTLVTFPAVFPINPEVRVFVLNKPNTGFGGVPPPEEKKKEGPPAPPFFYVYNIDFYRIIDLEWFLFIPAMIPFLLLASLSAIIVGGGIQMQNLESRQFGFVGAVLAILPFNVMGLAFLLATLIHWLLWQILEETETGLYVSIGVNVVLWLASAFVGGWSIMTLVDDEVIEGFEFVPQK